MPNPNDKVDFFEYNGDQDAVKKIATASLVDGKVIFEGEAADRVEKLLKGMDTLKPYFKIGGYTLLAQFPVEIHGTYFYATDVQEATIL